MPVSVVPVVRGRSVAGAVGSGGGKWWRSVAVGGGGAARRGAIYSE